MCGDRKPEAVEVITDVCLRRGTSLVDAWDGVDLSAASTAGLTTMRLRTPTRSYDPCTLALRGAHQVGNAVVSVRLLEALDDAGIAVPAQAIVDGLTGATWPGRLELVSLGGGREMLLDAAHNPAGAACLAAYLDDVYPHGLPLVFGALQDKDIEGMLRSLIPHATHIVVTSPPSPRAASPAAIATIIATLRPDLPAHIEPDPSGAISHAFQYGPAICVAGSIYLLGAILPIIPRSR